MGTGVAQAATSNVSNLSNAPSVANSPLSPNADWSDPVGVTNGSGYDDAAQIAASSIDGAVSLFWGQAPGNNDGWVTAGSNTQLDGPFSAIVLDANETSLNNVMAAAHDNLGRRHVIYWSWPRNGTLCDHYAIIDTDGNVAANEEIPGSCEGGVPRKLGGLAIDANNKSHILLGRNNPTGSMLYWERDAAGNYPVVREYVAQNCCPSDMSMAVSSQGVVIGAFKSSGISGSGTDIFAATRLAPNNWQVDDISAACCSYCPNRSNAYLPRLAADYQGGIRALWADGRCDTSDTDIYYREWVPGTGWEGQPMVRVAYNSGTSYYPGITVDPSGEAHLAWSDDTSSPINYYRIFYIHGRGQTFTGVQIPFTPWDGNSSYQKQSSIDYGAGYIHVAFSSNKYDPSKDNFYSNLAVAPPPTPTPVPTSTPVPTATPVPARCPGERFHDVCPGDYFYYPVLRLNDAGIVSGYTTSPPCLNSLWVPCFNPYNSASRAQMAKIVVLSANLPINTTGFPHFEDVSSSNVFSSFIETAFNAGVIGGYTCGGDPNTPCVPPGNRPYYLPGNTVTRGQITKMAAIAFNITTPPSGQTFQDVPPGSTFYTYTQQIAGLGIITGYACGGAGEPCVAPGNRPYYRPNNPVTRGQAAKIMDGFRSLPTHTPTPGQAPATRTSAPAAGTSTVTSQATSTSTGGETSPTPTRTGTPPSARN